MELSCILCTQLPTLTSERSEMGLLEVVGHDLSFHRHAFPGAELRGQRHKLSTHSGDHSCIVSRKNGGPSVNVLHWAMQLLG